MKSKSIPLNEVDAGVGGIVSYLVAHAAFCAVMGVGTYRGRVAAVGALVVWWAVGPHVPGYATLILVAATMATVILAEAVTHADQRVRPELS